LSDCLGKKYRYNLRKYVICLYENSYKQNAIKINMQRNMDREHFLHFRNAYLNSSSTTTSNARFNFTSLFGKVSNFSNQHSKWIKVFSSGIIIFSSYYYFKRCCNKSISINWNWPQLQLPFFSFCYRIKKLFLRPNIKYVENNKHVPEVKELSEHVKYDNGWFDELDELKKSLLPSLLPSSSLLPSLLPEFSPGVSLRETTPRGEIVMYYDAETKSFSYYSNSKNIPYSTLDAVARKYVCLYNVPSIYIDIRDEVQKGREKLSKKENALKMEKNERDKNKSANSSSEKKSLFAAFKNYKTGRNAPKSLHNYNGNVKVEEFVVLKNNINKFVYKGTLDQCDADLKSHADQQQRAHERTLNAAVASYSLIKDCENGSGVIDNFKLIYEKQDLSYADFKKKYNH
jgi:hypothetical protein